MNRLKLLFFFTFMACSAQTSADAAPWVGTNLQGAACNGGGTGYGPFDYTKRGIIPAENLTIVEHSHFTPEVENLIKGVSGSLESELNYTLRAWPNHHRALLSIINYQLKINNKLAPGQLTTAPECYLQRALHFSPEDAATYSLYGYYLNKMGQKEAALKLYDQAIKLAPDSTKIAYSYALLLTDLQRYDDAVKYAKIAYGNRHAPKGLRQKLEKLNLWNDTPSSDSSIESKN